MTGSLPVTDLLSNANEQIERAAMAIGRSLIRRKVFEAIYYHKSKIKTVGTIRRATNLTRMKVLQAGGHLRKRGIIAQTKLDGDTAYQKIDFFDAHKREVLSHAGNKEKLENFPTKRKAAVLKVNFVKIPTAGAKARLLTIDDVASFEKVKGVMASGFLPAAVSESKFKRGIQRIIGERGTFKDWGGEKSDLFTTKVRIGNKRHAAAFAFKGPGVPGKLVPSRMGKNGDQALRLFQEPAEIYFVQHWREIDLSVVELIRNLRSQNQPRQVNNFGMASLMGKTLRD